MKTEEQKGMRPVERIRDILIRRIPLDLDPFVTQCLISLRNEIIDVIKAEQYIGQGDCIKRPASSEAVDRDIFQKIYDLTPDDSEVPGTTTASGYANQVEDQREEMRKRIVAVKEDFRRKGYLPAQN